MRLTDPLVSTSEISNGAKAEQRNAATSGINVVFPDTTGLPKKQRESLLRANTLNQQGSIQTFQQKHVGSNIHIEKNHLSQQTSDAMCPVKRKSSKVNVP